MSVLDVGADARTVILQSIPPRIHSRIDTREGALDKCSTCLCTYNARWDKRSLGQWIGQRALVPRNSPELSDNHHDILVLRHSRNYLAVGSNTYISG